MRLLCHSPLILVVLDGTASTSVARASRRTSRARCSWTAWATTPRPTACWPRRGPARQAQLPCRGAGAARAAPRSAEGRRVEGEGERLVQAALQKVLRRAAVEEDAKLRGHGSQALDLQIGRGSLLIEGSNCHYVATAALLVVLVHLPR